MKHSSALGASNKSPSSKLLLASTSEEIAQLREPWLALEADSSEPCFFQSFHWCQRIAEGRQQFAANASYKPCVAVRIVDGEVTAIWPLSQQRSGLTTSLRSLDDPFGQMAGILAQNQQEADALVADCIASFAASKEADGFRIWGVPVGGTLHKALAAVNFIDREKFEAPFVDISQFATFQALKSSLRKKTMKNLRNAINTLDRQGKSEALVHRSEGDVRALIETTIKNRVQWLVETGSTAPAFRVPGQDAILTESGPELANQKIGFELVLDGNSLAQQWGFIHGGRYYAYMSSVSPDAWQHSPGKIHLAKVIEALFEIKDGDQAIQAIEMLTPASPYKMSWTDKTHDLVTMVADVTPRGKLGRVIWDETLREATRKLFYKLPRSIRGRLGH